MPNVKFTQDFDFSPAAMKGMVTKAYKAGMQCLVTTECADQAIAAGKAKRAGGRRGKADDGRG